MGGTVTLFLCGDVMTGRGVDQALPHAGDPTLHEPAVDDARTYLQLAERVNGRINAPLDWHEPWGDALDELDRAEPDLRVINLETAITTSDRWRREKGIHYRMHPANVPCLTAAAIDGCVLANNHVLDWDHAGLADTLATLRAAGIATAGAGATADEAFVPMAFEHAAAPVRVFAFGCPSSGIPPGWSATPSTPGVNVLPDLSTAVADETIDRIHRACRGDERIIVSIHWGENWGDHVPDEQARFARRLIDASAADVIHGHSAHHPRAIEVHRGKLILYGCGDFIDDYEGIPGHEQYRPDLRLMCLATLDAHTGRLERLRLVPLQARRLRLRRAGGDDIRWLLANLRRVSEPFATKFTATDDGAIDVAIAPDHW